METENNILETALNAVAQRTPTHKLDTGETLVIVPEGYQAKSFDGIERPLPRVAEAVRMLDVESFVAYIEQFKTEATRIFAEPGFASDSGKATMTVVIDYHPSSEKPDYCAHRAVYQPRYSEQWERWHQACSKPMRQAEFAEFIEEVRSDIRDPDAASLLDIVRTFKANKKVEFDSVVYQPGGDVKLVYDESTERQGSSASLPEQLKLGIPVYFKGTLYEVPVFVRYRVGNGAVVFELKMDRSDLIEETAFSELTSAVKEATSIGVYLGRQ